jgi:hypothetical protein
MRRIAFALLAFGFVEFAAPASAGVFSDDLSRCLVNKTTDYDQRQLKRWMFSAFSLDPTLAPLARIDPQQRVQIRSAATAIYNRLLVSDCRKEAVAALKNEGSNALVPAFGVLGRATAQQIFKFPQADAEFDRFADGFDKEEVEKLFREAGVRLSSE